MWQQSLINYLEALESETLSNSFQIENMNNLFNLNVNGAPGLYIVRMKFEDGVSIIKKLVIQ